MSEASVAGLAVPVSGAVIASLMRLPRLDGYRSRARDEFLGRDVAVKLIETAGGGREALRRDEDEVKVLARLNHHGLVTLFDAAPIFRTPQRPRIYW